MVQIMTTTASTASVRVSSGLASMLDEIARLTKSRTSAVCDRLFADLVAKELAEVRKRELSRLQAERKSKATD